MDYCFFVFAIDSNVLFLKKTDMESVFNLFQDREENKTLVYVSTQTSFFSTPHFLYQILTFHCMLHVNLCSFSRLHSRNRCSCHFCWENFSPVSFHWMRVLLFCKKWPAPPADRWPPVFTCAEVFKVSSYLLIILKCLKMFETTCFAAFAYVYNFYFKSTVNILYCELLLYTFTCQVNELWLVCTGKHSLWEPT